MSSRCRSSCGTCRRRAARRRRSGRTRWRCFAGSGSRGRWMSRGTRRRGARPATSAGISSSPASPSRPAAGRLRCMAAARRREIRAVDGGALRDGLPRLLLLSPGGRDRADREPVPAGQARAGGCAPQPDGAVSTAEGRPVPAAGSPPGPAADPRLRCSTSCSPGCPRTGTGHWSRSGYPPAHARLSFSVPSARALIPGQQLITVIRKGSRAVQQLPASPDAFVWLRLYQQEMHGPGAVRAGRSRCGGRCGGRSGRWAITRPGRCSTGRTPPPASGWTLHSLRHTAAYRLARDPGRPDHRRAMGIGPSVARRPRRCMSFRRPRTSSRARWPITGGRAEPKRVRPPGRDRDTGPRAWTSLFGKGRW